MKLIIKFTVLITLCVFTQAMYSMDPSEKLLSENARLVVKNISPEKQLFKYARKNKVEELQKLLEANPSLDIKNVQDENLATLLHWAAVRNSTHVVTFLLDKHACINAQDDHKDTPLHWATKNSNLNMVALLLKRGANIHARNVHGNTPLHQAAAKVVPLLLAHGAHVNALNNNNKTALHYAMSCGNIRAVDALLEGGADSNIQTQVFLATALHSAIQQQANKEAITRLMNDVFIDLSLKNDYNCTALNLAASLSSCANYYEKVASIIERKQQENKKLLRFLFFAVKFALENNRQKTFAGLIKNNRRIALALREAKTGNNILHLAIATRKPHLIEIALKYLPELAGIKNEKDNKTPLALPAAQPFLIKQILNHKLSKICQEHVVIAQLIESSSLETSLLGVKKRITRQLALAA